MLEKYILANFMKMKISECRNLENCCLYLVFSLFY